ncbi:DUF1150 family protein [Pseudoponticoccus marisrubri]|uniref:Uncharacterized protein n=1 Tax=Pseudoponticoccus marisrubri TaxID=1685382 RepID=A0A0W7WFU3_9RHOB|nr:DUF1150 domain-containing protein [Pseudoponticoccus marisrubri]KUF09426.1 hypothetical protein AVJ23_17445 [Pseudoponticoccus marisrubri]
MYTKHSFDKVDDGRLVYVRPVKAEDLPDDVREQVGGMDTLYAVHRADGERLALVKNRSLAFMLARQNDLAPVTVH